MKTTTFVSASVVLLTLFAAISPAEGMMRATLSTTTERRTLADASTFDTEHSALRLVVPEVLKLHLGDGKQGIKHSQALFGIPAFGKNIVGELIYATPESTETGCSEYAKPNIDDHSEHSIFLVDRGDCDFVDKMATAQSHGASAVLIADSICQCSTIDGGVNVTLGRTEALLKECDALGKAARLAGRLPIVGPVCETSLPYMADNGYGNQVAIPSFLISHADAQILKDCLNSAEADKEGKAYNAITNVKCQAGSKIILSLEWDVPTASDVTFEMWSSSDTDAEFKDAFEEVVLALADKIKFTPRYFIFDGRSWACNLAGWCGDLCTKNGLYCNKKSALGVSGLSIVEENLRELCVWQQAKAVDPKVGKLWWDYISKFAKECHPGPIADALVFTKECSKSVHDSIPGLNWAETTKCVASSDTKDGNTLLGAELEARTKMNLLQLPAMIINGALLRGAVNPQTVLGAICAGFLPSKIPGLCTCVNRASSQTLLECIESGCPTGQKRCAMNRVCYSDSDYEANCAAPCKEGQVFCASVGGCVIETAEKACPECPVEKPSWCALTKECTTSTLTCTFPVDLNDIKNNIKPSGLPASSVFGIVFAVVGVAALVGFYMWRRQREVLNAEVRSIMEEYRYQQFEDGGGAGGTPASQRGTATTPASVGVTHPRGYSRVAPGSASTIHEGGPDEDVI